jgi:hypothetical protein
MKHFIYLGALALLIAAVGCGKSGPDAYVDQPKAMEVTCVNNLKQIGLAFRIWQGDHKDKNPFEVSTNEGGVMELVTVKDGFRQNGYLIFQCMSNELRSPILLVCPQEKSKVIAKDWESLSESNVSYIFPAGNSSNVLAVCPIDGNILYSDGTVLEKSTEKHSP